MDLEKAPSGSCTGNHVLRSLGVVCAQVDNQGSGPRPVDYVEECFDVAALQEPGSAPVGIGWDGPLDIETLSKERIELRVLHRDTHTFRRSIALDGGGVSVLPFTRAVVPEIDLEAGHLTVEQPVETIAKSEDGA